jgi:hypothetical protein
MRLGDSERLYGKGPVLISGLVSPAHSRLVTGCGAYALRFPDTFRLAIAHQPAHSLPLKKLGARLSGLSACQEARNSQSFLAVILATSFSLDTPRRMPHGQQRADLDVLLAKIGSATSHIDLLGWMPGRSWPARIRLTSRITPVRTAKRQCSEERTTLCQGVSYWCHLP